MKQFLKHSGDMYVSERYPQISIGNHNISEHISVLLNKIVTVSESINKSLEFLEANESEVVDSINTIFDSLDNKAQILVDSIEYAAKLKYGIPGGVSDISVMDMSSAKYSGCVYSPSHGGIVLNNSIKTEFKLKEEV